MVKLQEKTKWPCPNTESFEVASIIKEEGFLFRRRVVIESFKTTPTALVKGASGKKKMEGREQKQRCVQISARAPLESAHGLQGI